MKQTLTELKAWHEDTGRPGRQRTLPRQPDRRRHLVAAAPARGRRARTRELRGLITGLPVAGVEGSLKYRFSADDARSARGMVRGKTGTLRQVHSSPGSSGPRDGSLLAYAFIVNGATGDFAASTWLDRAAAAVAGCGCQG